MSKPRSINTLIHAEGPFAPLLNQARRLRQVDSLLHFCLDAKLHAHCRVAAFDGQTLVLQADTPAWAAKLRYLKPQLLTCLRQLEQMHELQHIDLHIAPQREAPVRPKRRLQLSASGAELLSSLADSVSDPALEAALRRLARRGKPSGRP